MWHTQRVSPKQTQKMPFQSLICTVLKSLQAECSYNLWPHNPSLRTDKEAEGHFNGVIQPGKASETEKLFKADKALMAEDIWAITGGTVLE